MNKVFDKIIEKLEKLADELYKAYCIGFNSDDRSEYDAIEIVKQEAEKYNNGWIPVSEKYNSGWIPVSEKLPEIDEAIAKYKEITNTDSSCPGHCNISCDKCVQESRQIVEWLEELKRRREYDGEIIGIGALK